MTLPSATLFVLGALVPALLAQATNQGLKPGPWSARHAPEGWLIHETEHYQVQSQAGVDKAKRLAAHMEAMLTVYRQLFPTDRSLKQFAIKLFADKAAFVAYGGKPGAGAYYSATAREMVCYDSGKWMDDAPKAAETAPSDADQAPSRMQRMQALYGLDVLGAAAHEGWHQYFHRYITSWVEIPSWINEGMGDYFYCAVPKEQASRKAPAAELGLMNPMRLPIIRAAVKGEQHVSIAELLGYSQQQYYAKASLCYAEGWALCQFLLHSDNPRYRQVIPTFVRLVKDDTNMKKVTERAFAGIDLVQLEGDWKAWVLAAKLPWEGSGAKVVAPEEPDKKGAGR